MKTILIVDDEAKIREFIGLYFRASGYCVLEAEDGTKALQLLREESVSLVILDILMPGLDGFQVCQKIREKSDVPIIILTALNEDEQHIRGYEAGADDYVSKDVNPKMCIRDRSYPHLRCKSAAPDLKRRQTERPKPS